MAIKMEGTNLPVLFCCICIALFLPTCIAVGCKDPPNVQNADVTEEILSSYSNGTVIHYTCHYGYALNSSTNPSAICISGNNSYEWQLQSFSCEPACESIPDIDNGMLKLEGREPPFFTGDSISYKCNPGYTADVPFPTIICKNGSWLFPQEPCRARSCGYPGDIENSHRTGDSFTFPNKVTYYCDEGYLMKGLPTIFCTASGAWQPKLPSCDAVFCPLLTDPENGKVISPHRNYKAIATYECNRHYHLKGSAQRVCQGDARWDGSMPACIEVTCHNPGPLTNGRIMPNKTIYKAGDIAVFACNNDGKTKASKCLEDGTWKLSLPICEGPAAVISTESEVDVTRTNFFTPTTPTVGTTFPMNGSSCDDPGEIRNGKKVITGFSAGNNVTYSCEEGYEIRGQKYLICLPTGKWNVEKLPICVKPIPVAAIVSTIITVLILSLISIAIFCYCKWNEQKGRGYGKKSRALTSDAADLEEITGLEKEKTIPVTVL